jgi:terminase large subunit-like protein
VWQPQPGPQYAFLASEADEVFYGGAAGGGKSDALLAEAMRDIDQPGYHALLLRRTYPELFGKGSGLVPRSEELFFGLGEFDRVRLVWSFPSGATIGFGNLEHPSSVYAYHSAQFALIGFDELTSFLESQFLYLLSRLRSTANVRVRVRAAGNPGGIGHAWVRRRYIEKLRPYEIRWFKRIGEERMKDENGSPSSAGRTGMKDEDGSPSELEIETVPGDPDALSRQFIPARVFDNPALLQKDPGYVRRLKALDPVERRRLLNGDWYVANAGAVYSSFSNANVTADEPDRAAPIELAFDDGYHDPRAILFLQRRGEHMLVFDELVHTRHLGEQCVAEVVERCRAEGWPLPELAVGSPEAGQLHQHFRRADIPVRGMATPIVEGISAVRRLILDGHGFRALLVHRRCVNLLRELQGGYQYPPGAGARASEKPQDGDDHCVDALRYWVWMRYRGR